MLAGRHMNGGGGRMFFFFKKKALGLGTAGRMLLDDATETCT
jgi:hypothetical protein